MNSRVGIRVLMLIGCGLTAAVAILTWMAYHDWSMVLRNSAPAAIGLFIACFFSSRLKGKKKTEADP